MLCFISVGEFITSEGEVYLCGRGFSSVDVVSGRSFSFVGVYIDQ